MPRNNTKKNAALILLVTALVLGVIHLFLLRFQTGDIYPAYSSLRSDPLGTRAFYESLGKFEYIERQRSYQPLDSLKPDANAILFYLGADIPHNDTLPRKMSETLDGLTASGGRLVITYLPVYPKNEDASNSADEDSGSDSSNTDSVEDTQKAQSDAQPDPVSKPPTGVDESPEAPDDREASERDFISIREHWGFDFKYAAIAEDLKGADKQPVFSADTGLPDLPAAISWHTNLYFEILDNSWRTIYAVDGNPVVIERKMGQGSIVLCSDSYFISNEAMRGERHPRLLVWLMGGQSTVIFDESHFGLYKVPGVAGLLRRYQFHWFIGALAVVVLLFVWKNGVYFVPPPKEETVAGEENVSEKDYSRGLVALLRRNVGRSEILQVCGREWERTFKNDQRIDPDAVAQMHQILKTEPADTKKKSDPVSGYQQISRMFRRLGTYTNRG